MSVKTDLFSMMNNFFKQKDWNEYSQVDKTRNSFMINRFMSINFPIPSAMLSHSKVPGHVLVEFWKRIISKNHKSLPNWIYTKTKNTREKDPLDVFSEEVEDYFFQINNCSYKELTEYRRKFPDKLLKEFQRIDEMLKSYKK